MKKNILFLLLVLVSGSLGAQIVNNSFEQNNEPTLEGWIDICDFGTSEQDAPPNGGQWSLKMQPGQTQGCYPGYCYQVLPNVIDGQIFQLSGWAKTIQGEPIVGIYLAKLDAEGTIILLEGDTTSSQEWTMLSAQDTFHLEDGEVAVVLINSGLVGGPIGPSHSSFFDAINLDMATFSYEPNTINLKVFPNPLIGPTLHIETELFSSQIETISVYDSLGEKIFFQTYLVKNINVSHWKPGIYFLIINASKGFISEKIIKI